MITLIKALLFFFGIIDECPICEGSGEYLEKLDTCSTTPARVVCWNCQGRGSWSHARKVRA
jgi:DnaJ-class molecular chaperone